MSLKHSAMKVAAERDTTSPNLSVGIDRIPKTKDYFIQGILLRLWQEDGYAKWFGTRNLWKITEKKVKVIEGENP